jgi:hypothetical protein
MEITIEEIQKKFETLPEDLKWAIMAAKVDEKIIEIGRFHNLNVEQMGQLSLETHMVMLGYVHQDKFGESVQASLRLAPEKTKTIVDAINEQILKDLREKIMALHNTKNKESKELEQIEGEEKMLKETGIEISKEVNKTEPILKKMESPEEMLRDVENPKLIKIQSPILAQKLTGAFKMPSASTDHSVPKTPEKIEPVGKSPLPKIDPYRMSPDE